MPVTQSRSQTVRQRLATDDMLENERMERARTRPKNGAKLFDEMQTLREEILAHRNGKPIDVEKIMDDRHQQRDNELMDLY